MRLESLKKGFWGYKRDAVFQYITEQEELFSQKMAEKDAQLDRAGDIDVDPIVQHTADKSAGKGISGARIVV